jgi:hypothetical protein
VQEYLGENEIKEDISEKSEGENELTNLVIPVLG